MPYHQEINYSVKRWNNDFMPIILSNLKENIYKASVPLNSPEETFECTTNYIKGMVSNVLAAMIAVWVG